MRKSQDGFTIVEMLIALALFAILIPALTLGVSTLTQLNNRSRDLTLISIIAENKIESLRSLGYNSIAVGTIDFSSELPAELASPKSANFTITENAGIKNIDVSISYNDYKKTRTVLYKSAVSETGVGQ
jgi:prepilin-type N-terminal cleavage/methylation domain-containing protein